MKVIKLTDPMAINLAVHARGNAGFDDRVEFDFDARELRVIKEEGEVAFVLEVIADDVRESTSIGGNDALRKVASARSLNAVARRIKK